MGALVRISRTEAPFTRISVAGLLTAAASLLTAAAGLLTAAADGRARRC
jgi:hypothetical protein